VKSEPKLRQILTRLESLGFFCKPFFEPDRAGQLTAFATGPVRGDLRHRLRRYQCLSGDGVQRGDQDWPRDCAESDRERQITKPASRNEASS
jgi:hypothetical protein